MGSGKCCPNQPNTAPQRRPAEGEGLSPVPQVAASSGHDPGRAEGSGPRVSGQHVEPRSFQEHYSALVPTRFVWAPALDAPSRVTVGETGHHTAASHHKPSLLPPALRPLPPDSGPSPAGHPGQAPRPMADPPAPKASSDGVGLPSALTVPRALANPCGGFLLPLAGRKASHQAQVSASGGWACTGLGVRLSLLQTYLREAVSRAIGRGGPWSVMPLRLYASQLLGSSTVRADLNQPGSEAWSPAALATAELSSPC